MTSDHEGDAGYEGDETAEGASSRWGKSSFDDVYGRADPRAYFARLAPLHYQIPHHAQPVFRDVLADRIRAEPAGAPVTVVDLCCSYGINAALINHDVTLQDLYDRYTGPAAAGLPLGELIAEDKEFYAERRRADAVRIVGIDASPRAVAYAAAVGLLDAAFAANLETTPVGASLADALASASLVTVTGGLSYIGPRTFDAVCAPARGGAWVAAFAVRPVDYRPVVAALRRNGLVTRADARAYRQRRFTDADEQRRVLARVRAAGLDPTGLETTGYYYATLYQSRPAAAWRRDDGSEAE
ncbi:hypothetical protein LE181_07490 [Streptomyces sp. SCA3-4]|uniref:hypothetical protein n=1 Tax=Streptomyces sichuanensis TaxID=2871810 RepID=UPI001CE378F6|nr:hypothetical protein [Streptomyces sichuanensis]MCA6092004.1 hypothetical protein [Streptomyces sichuanensis]